MHRRRFLGVGAGALAAGLAGRVAGAPPALVPVHFVANPALATRPPGPSWRGTPVAANGQFMNLEYPLVQSGKAFLRFVLERNPQRAAKQADTFQLPVWENTAFLTGSDDVVVWLGHASFYVRLGGVSLLLDPVLGRLPVGGGGYRGCHVRRPPSRASRTSCSRTPTTTTVTSRRCACSTPKIPASGS